MFLDTVNRRNRILIDESIRLHQEGILEPDSYILDMDTFRSNSKMILEKANEFKIDLYFMLKQLGRNPILAKELIEMGYKGAVVVDFREAQVMMDHYIPLGNVGHLVQTPKHLLKKIIRYGAEVMTVFSMEKLTEINDVSKSLNCVQDVILKVSGEQDLMYSGQMSGIELTNLDAFLGEAMNLENIRIVGATAFPCYLYNQDSETIEETPNYFSVIKAIEIMKDKGFDIKQINVPSTTCVSTLEIMAKGKGTMGEPGHGLTGTTPMHAHRDLDESPAVIYLSEISHNFRGKSYCYGGGHYRRSHVKNCLVSSGSNDVYDIVNPVDDNSIDYTFEIGSVHEVSSSVIMAFRFQLFVTRSKLVLIEGLQTGKLNIMGTFDGLGRLYE